MRSLHVEYLMSVAFILLQSLRTCGDDSYVVEELAGRSPYVVVCTNDSSDAWTAVAKRLASERQAQALIKFDVLKPEALLTVLRKFQPDYVAYVMPPEIITPDLAGKLAEVSSRIRPDKSIDYASGYVTGITATDAMNLIERTLARESKDLPIPRTCTGVGHSWYPEQDRAGSYLVLASREQRLGPTLRLTDDSGNFKILQATSDVCVSQRSPAQNFQHPGLKQRLTLSSAYGSYVLIKFDLQLKDQDIHRCRALLEIPVDRSRWQLNRAVVVGCSPIDADWREDSVTWNHSPTFSTTTTTRAPADGNTVSIAVDVTSLLDKMQFGLAVFCDKSSEQDTSDAPLRHAYQYVRRVVGDCKEHGFKCSSVEAILGEKWAKDRLELLKPLAEGGLVLFAGHGSAESSCLVSVDDLQKIEIGPSVVIDGTCYGATTHQQISYGHGSQNHREVGIVDPRQSFCLQILRRGSLGVIGGTAKCSFGHVEPAITLLRDQHKSLGQAIRSIQNQFIESVPATSWEAKSMQPGAPGFMKVSGRQPHPTLIQYTIRTVCIGDPAFVPFPN